LVRGVRAAAAVLLAVGLACACGDDDESRERATDTTGAEVTDTTIGTRTTLDPEAEVEAAYLAYWVMAERLAQDPHADSSEIARFATGTARDTLTDSISTLRAQGHSIRFGPQTSHTVLTIDLTGNEATVRDCNIDDAARIDATGDQVESAVTTNLLESTLVRNSKGWAVSSIRKLAGWEGPRACE
jgi:hypothetical protein